ncbi:MAG: N-6 DNA methylase [Ktedonobacteraceae bacterium]
MTTKVSEMDTVVKKIRPYLMQRGYDLEKDLDFETPTKLTTRYQQGYVDILITTTGKRSSFLIEAKRDTKKLTNKDRDQAIGYGESVGVSFVVVTNGRDIQCFNVHNKQPIKWNGKLIEKIPTRDQLPRVLSILRTNVDETTIKLENDESLPFRPALPLKQLNTLFKRCHDTIRNIEKDEENAFADFSKLLFLRLLEEKSDQEESDPLPYSFRFYELAKKTESESDQIKTAISDMIRQIVDKTTYGAVLDEPIKLKDARTFRSIVIQLAAVSFYDSDVDSKGAAFEYFVRATLKGKKLGQYFTPRPLIQVMVSLIGREKLLNQLLIGDVPRVFDPACGTGGFLVYMMQDTLRQLEKKYEEQKINGQTKKTIAKRIKGEVFFGSDANVGVASAAKMNMIIAGDGHSNIAAEDSLSAGAKNWNAQTPTCDFILTNPPFGTSESQSLTKESLQQFSIHTSKGQRLFLQKMVLATKAEGEICTVIDEGVLNNDKTGELRKWILQRCRIKAIIRLPEETFKPNKINVRSSLIYMQRYQTDDIDLERNYFISFCEIKSPGYLGSGDNIRGFDFERLLHEVETQMLNVRSANARSGYNWQAYDISSSEIYQDTTARLDYKYWTPEVRDRIVELTAKGAGDIKKINTIRTARGSSPDQELYVDEKDGYALVVKAGNISKFGTLLLDNADYVEKTVYDQMELVQLKYGDVLVASTGDGTLGKCCTYRLERPAIADGHVTIIRVNSEEIYPEYLCDYLRLGFGAKQIERLYTGSTGLIELTPDQIDKIIIDSVEGNIEEQKKVSQQLRQAESEYQGSIEKAEKLLESRRKEFSGM